MLLNDSIPDQQQRQQALTPEQSFIVQAPAGSGKTGLLIQRFLLLLGRVNAPEQVVALTFTRKAAAEMRERVLAALQAATQPAPEQNEYALQTWQLAHAVLLRNQELQWHLLENPNRLRIQTIDSLCSRLTQQLPVLTQFGAQPNINEDSQSFYEAAAQLLLDTLETETPWKADLEHIMLHLDNNYAQVKNLLANMLSHREQWLPHVLTDLSNPTQLRSKMEQGLAAITQETLQKCVAAFPTEQANDLLSVLRFSSNNLSLEQDIKRKTSIITYCINLTSLPTANPEDKLYWHGIAELLLTQEGKIRKKHDKTIGIPSSSNVKNKEEKQLYEEMKNKIKEISNIIENNHFLLKNLHTVTQLPPTTYSDTQWRTVLALLNLLPLLAAQLLIVFQQHGSVDFIELTSRALQALGQPEAPSELALNLDYKIQHLLVDEFQDTSLSQFRLLERLTSGWQTGDGHTLFLVGDPMQSIYRFRQAEVGLFLQARNQGIGNVQLKSLVLQTNFRSNDALVTWFNQTFKSAFPQQEDINLGAITFHKSVAKTDAPLNPVSTMKNAVHIHGLSDYEAELEAEHILNIIQTTQQKNPQAQIAILVRSRRHLADILNLLQQAQLDYNAPDIEKLSHRSVINDLSALTRALLHPADRIAWLAILRAPWCGLTLHDLHALAHQSGTLTLWDSVQNYHQCINQLSTHAQQRLAQIIPILQQAMLWRGRESLRNIVANTWLALGGPACIKQAIDLKNAESFFTLLATAEQAGDIPDFTQFEQQLDRLHADTTSPKSNLHVMTIHKAKGLEFDVVILPSLAKTTRADANKLLRWLERPRAKSRDIDLIMAPIKASDIETDPIYQYLRQIEAEKNQLEMARLLYVAVTRAKQELHFIVPTEAPAKGSLLHLIWPSIEKQINQNHHFRLCKDCEERSDTARRSNPGFSWIAAQPTAARNDDKKTIQRLNHKWQNPILELAKLPNNIQQTEFSNAVIITASTNHLNKHIGTLIHQCLQQISQTNLENWDSAKMNNYCFIWEKQLQLLCPGTDKNALAAASRTIATAIQNTLNDPRGRWILNSNHHDAQSEYPITLNKDGEIQHYFIDRTFVAENGVRWIIDYKTSHYAENAIEICTNNIEQFISQEKIKYTPQLNQYAKAMQLLENNKHPIQLGLYFPLLQKWCAWSYQNENQTSTSLIQ